jgi:pyruvate dehydrogenase E1 component alpha subunit
MRGTDQVAVCFFGEGALGQGLIYEVMNMAALWSLPVIYLCENNLYSEYTHYSETTAGEILARAAAFGIPGEDVDGQDVLAVHAAATRAIQRGRRGDGPSFVVANTYRFYGHHVGDVDRAYYRTKEEEADWAENRDPISRFGRRLVESGVATTAELDEIAEATRAEIDAGVAFALDTPYPSEDQVTEHVYARN